MKRAYITSGLATATSKCPRDNYRTDDTGTFSLSLDLFFVFLLLLFYSLLLHSEGVHSTVGLNAINIWRSW